MESNIKLSTIEELKVQFGKEEVKDKFKSLLGDRTPSFLVSVLNTVKNNELLKEADIQSIMNATIVSASLGLPVNENLGFAYIIPFRKNISKDKSVVLAQFQMGYKGFIQLAQRSGQFKTISASPIYEGQLVSQNPLTGYVFDFTTKTSDKIIGYAGYFELLNGFQKTLYMSVNELKSHGVKYSQTMKKGYGLWKDNFDAMAIKTVIKLLLSKYAPLSVEMQRAVITDQSVIDDPNNESFDYVDAQEEPQNPREVAKLKEIERIKEYIEESKTVEELDELWEKIEGNEVLENCYTLHKNKLNSK